MRVLYFHQHFSTPQGAASIRSYQMARRLLHHGHNVTMVCGRYSSGNTELEGPFRHGRREGTVDGIRVVEFDLNYSNTDGFLRRAVTFVRYSLASISLVMLESYDVAFATTTPLTAGIPGIFARWVRHKPFVFEVRDLWPELPREMGVITNPVALMAMSVLEWASYRSAHRCIALSPGIAKGIEKRGVSPERIAMIPNGCDIEIFANPKEPHWRPEGVAESDLMAIYTGTHGQANGLDAVLDAAIVLQATGQRDIKLVLVGNGKLKPTLQERAKIKGLDNVIFHPSVPKDRLAGLMLAADLGIQCLANVSAFYNGTSPNKFFDYIAAGLPVLNNYPGWLSEKIIENECGWAVPPDDARGFAEVLQAIAANRETLVQKGRNASALAAREFNRTYLADKWVNWVTKGALQGKALSASPTTRSP